MFLIETKEGRRLVKLVPANSIDNEGNLQSALAEVGLAPQVFGKVSRAQLDEWEVRNVFSRGYDYAGILMEVIEDAWTPKETYFVPEFVSHLNIDSINEQLWYLQIILTELKIYPDDLQVLITKDSRVYLIDFGLHTYLGTPDSAPNMDELFAKLSKKIRDKIQSNQPRR